MLLLRFLLLLFAPLVLYAPLALALEDVQINNHHSHAFAILGNDNNQHESIRNPLQPLPLELNLDANKVALGNLLFHDARLSADDSISCASCHDIALGGVDQAVSSTGINGQVGPINAPTVLNSRFNFRQFWDGRAADLVEQAGGPVLNPMEMGSTWPQVLAKLKGDASLMRAFTTLYPDGLTPANIQDAIAEFERSLVTPAPIDAYLRGDKQALSDHQKGGLRLFLAYGCVSCHQGINIGGNMYQKMGLFGDYFSDRGSGITAADLGRFNVTQRPRDRHRFKVPTLRNVARTSPYFHDGSVSTLPEAVRVMARYQLGRTISDSEIALLVDFLNTLSGQPIGQEP